MGGKKILEIDGLYPIVTQLVFISCLLAFCGVPVIALVMARARRMESSAVALLLVGLLLGLGVGLRAFRGGGLVLLDFSSSITPFAFTLALDRLGAFFLVLICGVTIPVALFSVTYLDRHYDAPRRAWIWGLFSLFILSMILVVVAATAFAFLVAWELMTLFSAGLILIEGSSKERLHNLFIYLLMMHAGAAAVAASFFLFSPFSPDLGFANIRLASSLLTPGVRAAIFLVAFVGFGTKAGIIPFHLWLPRAHPIAPTPVSALMSGVMLKTAVYGFVRFSFDFLAGGPRWGGYLILFVGALSGVLGVLYAIGEQDLKRLLAYSSVENIGIIFMGLGSALIFTANQAQTWAVLALAAALFHTFNHALFKSLLFLGSGAIADATHSLDLEELGGLLNRMPVSGAAFLVGCASIVGLPLFNGFVSEWLTLQSFLAGSTLAGDYPRMILPLMAGALALIGGLGAACFIRVYGVAFLGRPRSAAAGAAQEAPPAMQWGMWLLAAPCVVLGIAPGLMLNPLTVLSQSLIPGATFPEMITSLPVILVWTALAVLVTICLVAIVRVRRRVTPTWACGLPGLTERMQYTSTAFSKPVRFVFSVVYKPDRRLEILPNSDTYFPTAISYSSVRTTSYERYLYRPITDAVIGLANQLRRIQSGNIQVYLLYIFLALILLLTVVGIYR